MIQGEGEGERESAPLIAANTFIMMKGKNAIASFYLLPMNCILHFDWHEIRFSPQTFMLTNIMYEKKYAFYISKQDIG